MQGISRCWWNAGSDGSLAFIRLVPEIIAQCESHGVGIVDAAEIDRINILQATFVAMRQSLKCIHAEAVIVDGSLRIPECELYQHVLPKADNISLTVAAASIIAKVLRDDLMEAFDREYPQYGFGKHKGYGSAAHFAALDKHGTCTIHRESFLVRWRERNAQAVLSI